MRGKGIGSVRASGRVLGVWLAIVCVAVVLATLIDGVGCAFAAAPSAGLTFAAVATPSSPSVSDNERCTANLVDRPQYPPCDAFRLLVRNAGSQPTTGGITVVDALPVGVTVRRIDLVVRRFNYNLEGAYCNNAAVRCEWSEPLGPDQTLEMYVFFTVQPGVAGPLQSTASLSGGGVPGQSVSLSTPVNSPLPFGVQSLTALFAGTDGAPETQAGAHPYELTTMLYMNTIFRENSPVSNPTKAVEMSVQDVKDVAVDLPVGLVGTVLAAPECTLAQLASQEHCPVDTTIGRIKTLPEGTASADSPLYNMVPERGVAAEFGYYDAVNGTHVLYTYVVPSPAGYVLRAVTPDVPQIPISTARVTLYGDPSERNASGAVPVAEFTNPSACSGAPLVTSVHADSWQAPGSYNPDGTPDFSDPAWSGVQAESPGVTGCERLQFESTLMAQPETSVGDSPTGLDVQLRVPQQTNPGSLATPPLRDATVKFPAGLTVNPSAASGLGACSEAQIGLGSAAQPQCPEASKIGTVEVTTPALNGTLVGSIYLARQNENPFHALLAGYVVIDDPTTGVLLKIPGNLSLDATTGQITGIFDEDPQFPFSSLRLHFWGGARGELATPAGCGTYATTSDLMPWSAPDSGPDATPSSAFQVESGCQAGFAPGFTAGSTNQRAGGYSPFALSITRKDGEQTLSGVSVTLPEGMLGKIAGIPLCPDAQANAGTCPEASRVGSVTAGAGVGPDPYFVTGSAYLTGPYKGGPYGLVEEVPAVAGPFNLGMVVVRQSLRINPTTAQVTAVSDPLPTILDGIPLQVRRVDVTLDRPGFTFNPTSCTATQVMGTVTSAQGASANVTNPFQVDGCRELPFTPSFKVSTQAKTSKQNGASLDVQVGSGQGQANIGKVAVTLPKQLPSRLTTIQQACPEATYEQNPASCPAGSNIGTATAHTPVLANPLTGPAYLVSHGGAAFPDLVLILQGENVTLELTGTIDIKHGITSSAFDSVPDAPISTFELALPEGSHSALTTALPAKAKGDLCGTSLAMPTTITGQNGAVIQQQTKIAVSGCPKAKKAKHRSKAKGRRRKG